MSSRMHPIASPVLRGPADTLVHAAPARPRPFLLAVAGASARGIESRGVEAERDGVCRIGRVVLLACEPFFLGGRHDLAVADERSGAVVVVRRDAENCRQSVLYSTESRERYGDRARLRG